VFDGGIKSKMKWRNKEQTFGLLYFLVCPQPKGCLFFLLLLFCFH